MLKQNLYKYSPLALAVALSLPALAQETAQESTQSTQPNSDKKRLEVIQIFGTQNSLETTPGSGSVLEKEQLELFEADDIHRVLRNVPGVYIREEDGYGLRPNIGLRGATNERSSKVALMEDSILSAPAPYAAPAAYYFPIVSRMEQVEVFKGPAAIAYGPNTVGGALNMISRQIAGERDAELDIAGGEQSYYKAHGVYSDRFGNFGMLAEAIHLRSDGFKELANDDNTGFRKSEFIGKASYEFDNDPYNQYIEMKYGYSEEVSHETYLGLTEADFQENPYQRYAATQNDQLDWEHFQFQLSHYIELTPQITLFTQAYRRDFDRDWDRFGGFESNRSIQTILSSPNTGANALFMDVLRGTRDTLSNDEIIHFNLNDRTYYSQGIQSKLSWDKQFGDVDLTIDAGLRIHQDQVERHQRIRFLNMQSGELVYAGRHDEVITDNRDKVTAIAGFINSKIETGKWHINAGFRVESIEGDAYNYMVDSHASNSESILLPGLGAFYQLSPEFGLLAGVNKGFVSNSPGQDDSVDPEESWNYEFGFRSTLAGWKAEAIGFYNDYSNLKATCTFSSGCASTELDEEFNGGQVDIYGLELSARGELQLTDSISIPVSMAYTWTQSEFQNDLDSEFSPWGNIQAGDELPYMPEHQFNFQAGLQGDRWRVDVSYKYVEEMAESAGTDTYLEGARTPAVARFDLAGWYQVSNELRLYGKVDNLTDEDDIVSRRPFGARPGKPRQIIVGAKYAF